MTVDHEEGVEISPRGSVIVDRERRRRSTLIDESELLLQFHEHHSGGGLLGELPETSSVDDDGGLPWDPTRSQRLAQMELFDYNQKRMTRRSLVDLRGQEGSFATIDNEEHLSLADAEHADEESILLNPELKVHKEPPHGLCMVILGQIPAIAVVSLLILMTSLPFGVAYFPIGWISDGASDQDPDGVEGAFPLPGKEALGIRMCLFATIIGQIVMTYASNFDSVAYQLIENVPFYHALANTVIAEQGYGIDALSTLFFLFGLSSVILGFLFYILGRLKLGRIVYFFPNHVLVGFIGGIGVFICVTAVSVTNNKDFSLTLDGIESFVHNFHLFRLVLCFEITLRILMWTCQDKDGRPKFTLLAPVFFCVIVPAFYLGLWTLGMSTKTAVEQGYFFPSPGHSCSDGECAQPGLMESVFDGHVLDMFRIIDFRRISWTAVLKSLDTVVSMASFSLIQCPINIPAFAVSADVDVDMNVELMAHGYANALSGVFGGLQTIMTYSFSVLFIKSGGHGRASSLGIVAVTVVLFIFGPQIATYIPRCMAGTLLLHIGVDLFLEGIYDSYGSFDRLEYTGIIVIAVVMTTSGMTAALVAGIIAALSVYAVQSITNLDPIFKITTAETLRSNAWTRSKASMSILDSDRTGRSRIMIVQLQGTLFFGNVSALTDAIKQALNERKNRDDEPFIVILDFTLVVGMDSSAAHSVAKLKNIMHRIFNVEVSIFVTGSHRSSFPCDYALAEALAGDDEGNTLDFNDISSPDTRRPARARRGSISVSSGSKSMVASMTLRKFPKNRVCDRMDEALEIAEDILIARESPRLLQNDKLTLLDPLEYENEELTEEEERKRALKYFENLVVSPLDSQVVKTQVTLILSRCKRESFVEDQVIWKQGAESDSMKLLVTGRLVAFLEGRSDVSEVVVRGSTVGELGLTQGTNRLTTLVCASERAVVYSLDRESWEKLVRENPTAALVVDQIVIRYLSHRVQHVSNRIVETRCLPI